MKPAVKRISFITTLAFLFISVVINVFLIGRYCWRPDRTAAPASAPAPKTARLVPDPASREPFDPTVQASGSGPPRRGSAPQSGQPAERAADDDGRLARVRGSTSTTPGGSPGGGPQSAGGSGVVQGHTVASSQSGTPAEATPPSAGSAAAVAVAPAQTSAGTSAVASNPQYSGARPPQAGSQGTGSMQAGGGSRTGTRTGGTPPSQTPSTETPPITIEPGEDRTPPVLAGLAFNPPEISAGSASTLTVTMTDDLSGAASVVVYLRSPSRAATIAFQTTPADTTGNLFTATVTVPAKAETGDWYICEIHAADRADNAMVATFTPPNVPAGGTLRVSSADSDSMPPVVHYVSVDKGSVMGGDTNVIRVNVDDDQSGVALVLGHFESPSSLANIQFTCHAGTEPGTWEGEFTIPANATCGEWTLGFLRTTDKAGNSIDLKKDAPALSRVGFGVSSRDCDTTPPMLESFSLAPSVVSNQSRSEVVVTLSIHDEGTGTTSVTGTFLGPVATNGRPPKIPFTCAPSSADPEAPWTARVVVPQYAAQGTWRVDLLRLQDRALNVREYKIDDPELASALFEVQ